MYLYTNGIFSSSGEAVWSNNYSIYLDGVGDFVSAGNVLDMTNNGTDAFTFSCWFKTTDTSTQILIGKQKSSSYFNGYNISLSNNKIGFFLGTTLSNARIQGTTGTITSITDGNWHHLAVTYDGSQNISGFTIYYDNTSQSITTTYNNTPADVSNTSDFLIGARGTLSVPNLLFEGYIDEVSYFNSELSASDVSTIYNSGVPIDISTLNPESWWRCGDGDTSTTMYDNGSNGNDGTLVSFNTYLTDVP
jgi:hypothetical protein